MFTLRRKAWIRWFPPIDSASPSPVTTHTDRSGRGASSPVAIAGARPWVDWDTRRGGAGALQPCRDRGRPPVDGMEAVGIDVVGEPARAADPRDEHEVLARHTPLGEELLHLRGEGVVPAAGAPTDVLIGDEVLAIERRGAHDGTSTASSPARSRMQRLTSSDTLNGRPWIFWNPTA